MYSICFVLLKRKIKAFFFSIIIYTLCSICGGVPPLRPFWISNKEYGVHILYWVSLTLLRLLGNFKWFISNGILEISCMIPTCRNSPAFDLEKYFQSALFFDNHFSLFIFNRKVFACRISPFSKTFYGLSGIYLPVGL